MIFFQNNKIFHIFINTTKTSPIIIFISTLSAFYLFSLTLFSFILFDPIAMTARSSSSPRRNHQYPIDDHDLISKLPDELLQMILSKLSIEEAVRTSVLSSRWVDVWKWRSHLVLDMNKVLDTTPYKDLAYVSFKLARSMTKVRQLSSLLGFHFNHFL